MQSNADSAQQQSPPQQQSRTSLNININNSASSNMKADFTPKIIRNGAAVIKPIAAIAAQSNGGCATMTTTLRKYNLPPPPVVSAAAFNTENSYASRRANINGLYQTKCDDKAPSNNNGGALVPLGVNSSDTYYISPLLYGKSSTKGLLHSFDSIACIVLAF